MDIRTCGECGAVLDPEERCDCGSREIVYTQTERVGCPRRRMTAEETREAFVERQFAAMGITFIDIMPDSKGDVTP